MAERDEYNFDEHVEIEFSSKRKTRYERQREAYEEAEREEKNG